MFILETHLHKLLFRIDNGAPKKYINRWEKIKHDCEQGDNKYIIEKMKTYCKLNENKNIPYLIREEGGIGGNNNIINKQIRFFRSWHIIPSNYNTNVIIFDQIINTDTEKWSYEELDDIIYGLIKTFNYFMETECIQGVIEISNINNDSDNSDDYI